MDKVYIIVRSHYISGEYPEDFWDYGDTYIGVFAEKYEARRFIESLPPLGEKDEKNSDDDVVIFQRNKDSKREETYRYRIEEVPYLSY